MITLYATGLRSRLNPNKYMLCIYPSNKIGNQEEFYDITNRVIVFDCNDDEN